MAKIRVITEDLLSSEKEIISIGLQMGGIGAKLLAISLLARTYDNNTFGPEVKSICKGAASTANSLRSSVSNLGESLGKFILRIIAVDEGGIFSKIANWWNKFTDIFRDKDSDQAGITNNESGKEDGKSDTEEDLSPTEVEAASPQNYGEIALTVPFDGETSGNPYDHVGFADSGYPKSNCTWYVWEAIVASTGVTLPKWGSGAKWPQAAKDSGYTVDSNPTPGSILCFGNHVGFVESVEYNTDGSVKNITWSEEQATGQNAWKTKGTAVKEGELRWRVTSSMDYLNSNLGPVQFIHVE